MNLALTHRGSGPPFSSMNSLASSVGHRIYLRISPAIIRPQRFCRRARRARELYRQAIGHCSPSVAWPGRRDTRRCSAMRGCGETLMTSTTNDVNNLSSSSRSAADFLMASTSIATSSSWNWLRSSRMCSFASWSENHFRASSSASSFTL